MPKGEVRTESLLKHALNSGKNCYVPYIVNNTEMVSFKIYLFLLKKKKKKKNKKKNFFFYYIFNKKKKIKLKKYFFLKKKKKKKKNRNNFKINLVCYSII